MAFGVDSTGFTPKTVTDIISSLQTGYRGVYGAMVNVAARSRVGQRIALFAGALAEGWELGEALFNALDPDSATGGALDNVLKLNGLERKPATFSKATLTLVGTATTVVNAGKRASIPGTTTKFALDSNTTINVMAAWTTGATLTAGARRTANGNVYNCIQGGVTAGAGTGPSGTGQAIVDNTVIWQFLGAGNGSADGAATATATGPLEGFAGTINTIDTPVAGWANVTNLLDASTGQDSEQDPDARIRRAQSFSAQAESPLEAVRTAVLAVAGVTDCTIFENYSDGTNADGVPAKAFETLVQGGADAEILQAIFSKRPGGIQPYGTTSGTVNDSLSNPHTIAFSRPSSVNIYVAVMQSIDATTYPANGDVQTQDAIATRGNAQKVGRDVVASQLAAGIFQDMPGIFDVSQVLIGTVNPPVASTTVPITSRQKAAFDTSRITVISAPGNF